MKDTQRLRKTRKLLGWTQHALEREAGIRAGKIASWETGRLGLTPAELERVKNALARRAKEVTEAVAAA